ncbi:MAG: raiA [Solirubrobacterales bacterium]|jgi:putative sigma-54 modulation protein|nr:raiA [Solirubrobacterales bacterium]
MQIAIKGRGIPVSDNLRERVEKRFAKVGNQVSDLATLEVEIRRERNPAIQESEIVEVTLRLKGVTLRACERARDLQTATNMCADDLARQVKRHRDKRRRRREAHAHALRPAL